MSPPQLDHVSTPAGDYWNHVTNTFLDYRSPEAQQPLRRSSTEPWRHDVQDPSHVWGGECHPAAEIAWPPAAHPLERLETPEFWAGGLYSQPRSPGSRAPPGLVQVPLLEAAIAAASAPSEPSRIESLESAMKPSFMRTFPDDPSPIAIKNTFFDEPIPASVPQLRRTKTEPPGVSADPMKIEVPSVASMMKMDTVGGLTLTPSPHAELRRLKTDDGYEPSPYDCSLPLSLGCLPSASVRSPGLGGDMPPAPSTPAPMSFAEVSLLPPGLHGPPAKPAPMLFPEREPPAAPPQSPSTSAYAWPGLLGLPGYDGLLQATLPFSAAPEIDPHGAGQEFVVQWPDAVERPNVLDQEAKENGKHTLRWAIDARKLDSQDKQHVSPQFQVCFPGQDAQIFQLVIIPTVVNDGRRGAGFKKAKGRGKVVLKCQSPELPSTYPDVNFWISIGSGETEQPPRGPVTHKFSVQSCSGLSKGKEEWDFKSGVDDSKTVTVTVVIEPCTR